MPLHTLARGHARASHLSHVRNTGVAFGLFDSQGETFTTVVLALVRPRRARRRAPLLLAAPRHESTGCSWRARAGAGRRGRQPGRPRRQRRGHRLRRRLPRQLPLARLQRRRQRDLDRPRAAGARLVPPAAPATPEPPKPRPRRWSADAGCGSPAERGRRAARPRARRAPRAAAQPDPALDRATAGSRSTAQPPPRRARRCAPATRSSGSRRRASTTGSCPRPASSPSSTRTST